MLVLEELRITHHSWEKELKGAIKYRSEEGEITIKLTAEHIARILPVVADALVATSKEVAENLKAAVITQALPALEHSSGQED
jgi:hypothetical protein